MDTDSESKYLLSSNINYFSKISIDIFWQIIIVLLITIISGWFIYSNTIYNLYEKDLSEKILYQNTLIDNINYIEKYGYEDDYLKFESVFPLSESSLLMWHAKFPDKTCFRAPTMIYHQL